MDKSTKSIGVASAGPPSPNVSVSSMFGQGSGAQGHQRQRHHHHHHHHPHHYEDPPAHATATIPAPPRLSGVGVKHAAAAATLSTVSTTQHHPSAVTPGNEALFSASIHAPAAPVNTPMGYQAAGASTSAYGGILMPQVLQRATPPPGIIAMRNGLHSPQHPHPPPPQPRHSPPHVTVQSPGSPALDRGTPTEATAPALPNSSWAAATECFVCICGTYSHWNLRREPDTTSEVVAICYDGDVLECDVLPEEATRGWLRVSDGSGWVRSQQGDGRWEVTCIEQRDEQRRNTTWDAIEFAEATGRGSALLRRDPATGGLFLWTTDEEVVVRQVQYDGRRTLRLDQHISLVVPWDAVATLLAALAPLTGIPTQHACPSGTSEELFPYLRGEPETELLRHTLVIDGVRFRPPHLGAAEGWGVSALSSPPRVSPGRGMEGRGGGGGGGGGGVHPMHSPTQPGFDPAQASFRRRLMNMYQFYRPEKLPSVMPTVHSSAGMEQEVMAVLTDKYGPEPRDCMSRFQSDPLRPGWTQVESRRGDVYYVHVGGEKQWVRPSEFFTDCTVQQTAQGLPGMPNQQRLC